MLYFYILIRNPQYYEYSHRNSTQNYKGFTQFIFEELLSSDEHTIDVQELLRKAREKVAERAEAARKSDQGQAGMPASLKFQQWSMFRIYN